MISALIALSATIVPLVTHGTDDASDPGVVAIVDAMGTTGCTGSLIAPHFVLTAAHCIVPGIRTGAHAVFGASVASPLASVPIVGSAIDPSFDVQTLDDDAAILVLGSSAPGTPIPMASSAPAVGSTIRVVGFGLSSADAGATGTKRQGAAQIAAVGPLTLSVVPDPSQPCEGDSGGPALATIAGAEVIAGITSHGDAPCQQSAVYTRVDAVRTAFIEPTLTHLGNGTVGAGGRCLYPEQCKGGASACVVAPDDANVSYCSEACPASGGCPSAMTCTSVAGSGSQCRYLTPTPGAMGATCRSDSDCVDASCLGKVCTEPCAALDPSCPSGFTCQSSDGIDYTCLRPPPAPSRGGGGGGCDLTASNDEPGWILSAIGLAMLACRRRLRTGPERR